MSMLGVGPQDVGKKAPRVPTYMQNGAAAPVEDENDPWLKGLDELADQEGNQFSQVDPLVEAVDVEDYVSNPLNALGMMWRQWHYYCTMT